MKRSLQKNNNSKDNLRSYFFVILSVSFLLIIFCFRWQFVEAARFSEIGRSRVNSSELNSQRGSIYSSDGSTLAYSEPRFDIFVWIDDLIFQEQNKIQTREEFVEKVAPIINTEPNELKDKLDQYFEQGIRWVPVAKSIGKEEWESLLNLKTEQYENVALSGIHYEITPSRIYPEGRLASHLLGLTNIVNNKIVGQGGIEEAYNGVLSPVTGFVISETDAIGQTVANALLPTIEPKDGSDIYTTINKRLQFEIERLIEEGVNKYQATSGSVVIMDPKTGAIMALANYPDYDPNLREETEPSVYVNSAVTAPFEAGSVGKTLTFAAAIDLGLIDGDTVVLPDGHQGCEKFTNDLEPLCTWDKKPQGPMTANECLSKSDNICFLHIAEMIPRRDYYNYLDRFGVGKPTGVDIITQDSYGILKNHTEWNVTDVAAYSYGHGYQVNLIQTADYVSTLANNGVRMKPRVVEKVVSSDGDIREYRPIVVDRVISSENAEKVTQAMRLNYQNSFAANEWFYNDLKNYDIGVKSGTALIATSTGYSNDINATFVGYDASDERSFVMVVKLERPTVPFIDRLAFYNVRPLWLDIFSSIKDIIGVPRK